MQNRNYLIIAFIIPILVLAGITINAQYQNSTGIEISLPIQGYDPRDFLSGYYLAYTIDYGVAPCEYNDAKYTAYVCVDPKGTVTKEPVKSCSLYIKGECEYGLFYAGIEKFYAHHKIASSLEETIRTQPMEVVLSVTKNGTAQVKYLNANGKIIDEQ